MGSEYVGIPFYENNKAKSEILSSQLGLLNIIKSFSLYKSLRVQELAAKIALKTRIGEIFELLQSLDKQLPHPKYRTQPFSIENKKVIEHNLELEDEIEDIKKRLDELIEI